MLFGDYFLVKIVETIFYLYKQKLIFCNLASSKTQILKGLDCLFMLMTFHIHTHIHLYTFTLALDTFQLVTPFKSDEFFNRTRIYAL